jgi:hypothetical protein
LHIFERPSRRREPDALAEEVSAADLVDDIVGGEFGFGRRRNEGDGAVHWEIEGDGGKECAKRSVIMCTGFYAMGRFPRSTSSSSIQWLRTMPFGVHGADRA